ncbi:hypothetical protein [Rubrivirga marina]|uniref:Uncharacterized protein n=1 Tax=Rubrivirga marina TaxID=1196024 RepID=A0A271IXC5_9BACT|nr:hypothetical protein [Rubrivirga marina]PAP75474.1 hypothetical protein BSZ37_02940 [Rubrivirga marina]
MTQPWKLLWYHFGDLIAASSTPHSSQGVLRASLTQADKVTLQNVFTPATRTGVPALAEIFRTHVLPAYHGKRRSHAKWTSSDFSGFRVQIVQMPARWESEALLTPDSLYLSGDGLVTPELADRLSQFSIEIQNLPPEATTGQHMWMMTTMAVGDVLTRCYAADLESDGAQADAFLRVATDRLREHDRVGTPDLNGLRGELTDRRSKPEFFNAGRFVTLPPRPTLERRHTFLMGEGSSDDGTLILQFGTKKNESEGLVEAAGTSYNPWPCGGFTDCSPFVPVDCDEQKKPITGLDETPRV